MPIRPFGMLNFGLDNTFVGDWGSGYRYNSGSIKFFTHILYWQLSGIPVLSFTINMNQQRQINNY
jgi:hypothetical protein